MPEPAPPPLKGRVAIITGAAGGIGRASAAAFAAAGANLLLADRSSGMPAGFGHAFQGDLSRASDVRAMVDEAVRTFGRLDILFNVAGMSGRPLGDGPVDTCSEEAWDAVITANLKPVFLACHAALPEMIRSGGGAIINLSSVLGMTGGAPHFTTHAYAASKAAIIGLTRAMAAHYAARHIRVNCLSPGLIDTPMSERARSSAEVMEWAATRMPLGPPGRPEDVAQAALFLASDAARFITGAVLPVDGGWMTT